MTFSTRDRKLKTNLFRDMFNLPYHLSLPSINQKTPRNHIFDSRRNYMKLYPEELLTGKSVIKNQTAGESSSCLAIVFLLDLSTTMKRGRPKLHHTLGKRAEAHREASACYHGW